MRTPILFLLTFTLAMFGSSVVSADWLLDFDDGNFGSTWGFPAASIRYVAADGILRVSSERQESSGGIWVDGIISDTHMSADINPAMERLDDYVGLFARSVGTSYYFGGVRFDTGELTVGKQAGVARTTIATTRLDIDPTKSYFLEMDVVGSVTPRLTARLYEEEGGVELGSAEGEDPGSFVFPAGVCGTVIRDRGAWGLNATYDNVAAITIPEPSCFLLTSVACLGLLACRRRRHKKK